MAFFFFFDYDDFASELKDFNITNKISDEQQRIDAQIESFAEQFPISLIERFLPSDYFRQHGKNKGDFWYWVTKRSNSVGGSIPWSSAKLNSDRKFVHQIPLQERFDGEACRALVGFIKSKGLLYYNEVRHLVGSMIALRLLILYYPDEFIHIVRQSWLDQILYAFRLDSSDSLVGKSKAIRQFYDKISHDVRHVPMVAFVQLLDDYIGLSGIGDKKFYRFLKSENGVSDAEITRCERALRKFSKVLQDNGVIQCSLYKVNDLKWFSHILQLSGFLANTEEYRDAIRWFYKFLESKEKVSSDSDSRYKTGVYYPPLNRIDPTVKLVSVESLVGSLKSAARARKFLRHYTSITSFLSIAESCSFRLRRGDDPRMNDQLEWRKLGSKSKWKRTFILSLSGIEDESAAMWSLYGRPSNEALRLTLRRETIEKWFDKIQEEGAPFRADLFPLAGEKGKSVDIPNKMIAVMFADVIYGGKVGEIDDGPGREYRHCGKKVNLASIHWGGEEGSESVDKAPEMTGMIKSRDWEYEDECRLIACIKEDAKIEGVEDLGQIQYIYIPITKELLSEFDLMIGPCVSDKLAPVFKSKLGELLPGTTVSPSKYAGYLIFK